jgi:DNA-binding MarR family transcriptional regulator
MSYHRLPDGSFADVHTGEILDNNDYQIIAIPRRIKIKEGWFMAFQEAFEALATDKDLNGQTMKVLMFLMARLSFENYIGLEQKEIAEKLCIHKSDISHAIKALVGKGILEKGPKLGRSSTYKLNPYYGWKGRVKNLNEERKKRLSIVKNGQE